MKLKTALIVAAATLATSANAALDATVVNGIKTEVLGDVTTATTAGFAILAASLGAGIGMSLLGRFISKGANGG